jgi:hypothetical protein
MFPFDMAQVGLPGRRRGLTTFKALWPELRLILEEARQRRAPLDWARPHEDARTTRWACLAANDRLQDRGTA